MARLTNRSDPAPDLPPARRLESLARSLTQGQVGDIRIRIGWSLPVVFGLVLVGGWWLRVRPGNADLPVLSGILAAAMVGGAIYQGLVRVWIAKTLGGRPRNIDLRAFGSWGRVAATPSIRLILGFAVPLMTLAMACALAAMPPHGEGWQGVALLPPELTGKLTAASVLIACIWVLTVQATIQTLPLPGCHGREVLVAAVDVAVTRWPLLQREPAIRFALGIMALVWVKISLVVLLLQPDASLPSWPWLTLIGIACWLSRSLPIEANEPIPATPEPSAKPGPAMRSPWQVWTDWKAGRRLRALRAREWQEAADTAQLDAILDQLHQGGPDALTSEQQAVLQRVSRRFRESPNAQPNRVGEPEDWDEPPAS